ncbi:hypothetical protein L6452_03251 [Arctium lappa]|uniref:Uncharacterized protein n=1 Tax=Arctium lappa TaxID=4217 RepID=A0ACB9FNB1_ARCLA|nr:hypothetical protein L6452_03251 [Arctium lappa]
MEHSDTYSPGCKILVVSRIKFPPGSDENMIKQSEENEEWVSSTYNYGIDFISSIRRGNVHVVQFHPEKSGGKFHIHDVGLSILRKFLLPNSQTKVIACLDVRTNDNGDLVVPKGDQYDVREQIKENEVIPL